MASTYQTVVTLQPKKNTALYIYVIFLLCMACSSNQTKKFDLIISNVHLIDGTGDDLRSNVNIYIKENKIIKIDSETINQAEHVINGTDKYIIPGLFDGHAHTNNYKYDFPRFIHYGVTSIFVPGGSTCTNEYYASMRSLGASDTFPAPRVFHTSQHFTMEGRHPVRTYASSNWVEGKTVYYLRDTTQIETLVQEVAQFPIAGIKLTIEDGPMPPFIERMPQKFIDKVVREARKNELDVFAHVSDNAELTMALHAGIQNIIHFTGVDLDFVQDSNLVNAIYRDSISWVTTLMLDKSFLYPLNPEWIEQPNIQSIYSTAQLTELQDPNHIHAAHSFIEFIKTDYNIENPTLENIIKPQVADIQTLYQNGVNMVLGTDTGNDFIFHGLSLHEEMQLMELGGFEPLDIIKMGTHNAAKMLHALDTLGTIEAGKIADMILLNKNPLDSIQNTLSIQMVINDGVIQQRINAN